MPGLLPPCLTPRLKAQMKVSHISLLSVSTGADKRATETPPPKEADRLKVGPRSQALSDSPCLWPLAGQESQPEPEPEQTKRIQVQVCRGVPCAPGRSYGPKAKKHKRSAGTAADGEEANVGDVR